MSNIEPKNISITPALTSLLKPTADMLGTELRDFIQNKIKDLKTKKKAENLREHLRVASEKLSEVSTPENINIQQFDLLEDWAESAQNVDPEAKDLASMWQDLLCSLSTKQPNVRLMMEKLKQLDPEDAIVLMKLKNGSSQRLNLEERYRIAKLTNLDLVEKNEIFIQLLTIASIGIFILIMILSFSVVDLKSILISEIKYTWLNFFLLSIPVILYFGTTIYLAFLAKEKGILAHYNRKLTWIGKRITSLNR